MFHINSLHVSEFLLKWMKTYKVLQMPHNKVSKDHHALEQHNWNRQHPPSLYGHCWMSTRHAIAHIISQQFYIVVNSIIPCTTLMLNTLPCVNMIEFLASLLITTKSKCDKFLFYFYRLWIEFWVAAGGLNFSVNSSKQMVSKVT